MRVFAQIRVSTPPCSAYSSLVQRIPQRIPMSPPCNAYLSALTTSSQCIADVKGRSRAREIEFYGAPIGGSLYCLRGIVRPQSHVMVALPVVLDCHGIS